MPQTLRTIDDVIAALDDIVETCYREASRLGYFPAMYRKTTRRVQEGLEAGRFEDPDRLETLDVVFADRYIAAFREHRRGDPSTASWEYAFRMAGSDRPSVVQHLLLGMNAHINLDLAISAVEVAPGSDLPALKHDFDEINDILGELVDPVQNDLGSVFPLVRALDFLCLRLDETAVRFAVRRARASAWEKATILSAVRGAGDRGARILAFDREVAALAERFCPSQGNAPSGPEGDSDDPGTVRRIIEALVD
jgi:hypothetical protein